jgi:hypothetical protein
MLRVSEILIGLVCETLRWVRLAVRSNRSIKAENLFLRRQLALYIERGVKPAGRFRGGSPRDVDWLAPSRMETVLAAEVPARPTADSPSVTSADSPDFE